MLELKFNLKFSSIYLILTCTKAAYEVIAPFGLLASFFGPMFTSDFDKAATKTIKQK